MLESAQSGSETKNFLNNSWEIAFCTFFLHITAYNLNYFLPWYYSNMKVYNKKSEKEIFLIPSRILSKDYVKY